ncbi:unnamed protein product [Didymodactylos carnosus]|uniref:Esterase n=1 Tax=Didymodactylos carnosus TaxID=1234261 RepID=A0A814EQJ6_9BILA|nr:unnamed protein product [Didymodactylos carnosus]CAF3744265.1 unnamed protein product [Didymodactylos carnosus]
MSSLSLRYAYLHGFASSASSKKGVALKAWFSSVLNKDLLLPDLNIPSFQTLSVTKIVDTLEKTLVDSNCRWCLIGSSLGGLCATLLTQRQKELIHSLILLCPALEAEKLWSLKLSETQLNEWKTSGVKNYFHYITQKEEPLHYEFYNNLKEQINYPLVNCPVTIIHGIDDDLVPIETSRHYVQLLKQQQNRNIKLIEVQDDHLLSKPDTTKIILKTVVKQWFPSKMNNIELL